MHVLVVEVQSGDPLDISDRLKQQHAPAAIIVGARDDGNVQLVINVDPSLESRGVHAGNVIREAAALIGGGGRRPADDGARRRQGRGEAAPTRSPRPSA